MKFFIVFFGVAYMLCAADLMTAANAQPQASANANTQGGNVGANSDLSNLFKRLDGAIATNKNSGAIANDMGRYNTESIAEREKNYKEFNEAAKKFHLFRAKKIAKTVDQLIKEYKNKTEEKVNVQRYSAVGSVKFAYVSGVELDEVLKSLETNGELLKNLNTYKKFLGDLQDYDIKTIAKVLAIVEQEIMNVMNFGVKKEENNSEKKEVVDMPVQLKSNQMFKKIRVMDIDEKSAKLKVIL